MTAHRCTFDHADLSAEVVPCDSCGAPADARTRRQLRRQLRRLQRANRALAALDRKLSR